MTAEDNLEKQLEDLGRTIGADNSFVHKVMTNIQASPLPDSQTGRTRHIWSKFTRRRLAKLAAAAILVIVLIGIGRLHGATVATVWAEVTQAFSKLLHRRVMVEKSNRPDLMGKPTGAERIKAYQQRLQIPPEELESISTEALVKNVNRSPLSMHMITFPAPDGGLSAYRRKYNGVNELLSRPDAATTLLNMYTRDSHNLDAVAKGASSVFCFAIMEVLMSSDEIIKQVTDASLQDKFLASIIESHDLRVKYNSQQPNPVFGQATLPQTATAIGKLLDSVDCPEYKRWYAQKLVSGLFVERPVTYEESEELLSMAREYLRKAQTPQEMSRP